MNMVRLRCKVRVRDKVMVRFDSPKILGAIVDSLEADVCVSESLIGFMRYFLSLIIRVLETISRKSRS